MISNFYPQTNHMNRSPGEMLARHVADMREKTLPGGMALDRIAAFKFRFKMGVFDEKKLRMLSAKDLKYVMEVHDGKKTLDMVIKEAAQIPAKEGNVGDNVVGYQGPLTLS